eukprot:730063-Rhodomonas_salina.1
MQNSKRALFRALRALYDASTSSTSNDLPPGFKPRKARRVDETRTLSRPPFRARHPFCLTGLRF